MQQYKRILLAVDFFSDNDQIIDKAVQTAKDNDAELFVVNVIEPVSAYPVDGISGWGPQATSLQSELRDQARQHLDELASRLNVKKGNAFICNGKASNEIRAVADKQDIDLIVPGTHGQHGSPLLLGSTANSVLHGVSCDV
ncbi:MAG: universal stress protein, partial [Pseudomonadales bacterium]|nr:universal stress protein [Pseudomonadales bacterium]